MISMLMLIVALLLGVADPSPTYRLTVVGGSGSGVYTCGSNVKITGDKTRQNSTGNEEVFSIWFGGWDGNVTFANRHERSTTLKMPCMNVQVEARFTGKAHPPKPKG